MKFGCEYALSRSTGPAETGPGAATLSEEALTLAPKGALPLVVPWEEITAFSLGDYRAKLALRQAALTISSLGYQFENFAQHAARLRNERLLKLALAEEPLKKSMIEAELAYKDTTSEFNCRCELRIYETSLVALPETADFLRLPFRFITEVKEGDYNMEITGECGERWSISGLGRNYDHFRDSLRAQMAELDLFVQKALAAALPGVSPLEIRALSGLLREGRLVPLAEAEKILPGASAAIEKRVCWSKDDSMEYNFLKKLSATGKTAFGVKKGLMGKLGGDHHMFLFCAEKPAPAVMVESFLVEPKAKETTDKKATYVYRLPPGAKDPWAGFLSFFNRAMTAVNFRHMPVLLSEERLADPKNAIYTGALARIPELAALRQLYVGRAIHSGTEQWKAGVSALLDFAARNPGARQGGTKEDGTEEDQ
ncbi:MAG: hypothetical protein A2X34_06505 [Elusimicrobia bacterium GWC2_51_8]|nr:MAG: hypothetical protein A2X33_08950 [Elusimicrobia bacterium GWA2_51_34]OGR60265.1 MAG: hypothetical protein A2X34_06505 [Elusimicrobia bacterium GWC2_51_8]OGR86114.1 MAG: hypothetical protein A2021_01670 [Elusimicrobia bacterium GWF2_52_66]HAF96087.1 hypothetical protein [Elusimicrobiota bacterium]HCE98695.1 hypothetical protein [Elusimicrobiota bacterium]